MKINERINQYIESTGLKQEVIAKKAGYSEKQFNGMLQGSKTTWADDYERICCALGKEPNDFMGMN